MTAVDGRAGSRVAVVLDFGAASPLSILAAARGLCDVVFVSDRDLPYVRAHADDLAAFGTVCDITGMTAPQAASRVAGLRIDGITTFSEAQLGRTAALAGHCGLAYLSPLTARALTDKLTQRRVLAEAGVQSTRCQVIAGLAGLGAALADVGLPAVLKPRTGAGGAYTCRVDTAAEAAARLQEFLAARQPRGEFVVEQLLTGDPAAAGPEWGDYVSVESVTSRGITQHIEITGKFPLTEPFRETGYFVPATLGLPLRQAVLALTGSAIAALGVRDGATHIEVKLTPAGPKIIEVNGRLGGYVADIIRTARGFDLVRATLAAALGRAPAVPAASYRRHAFQYFILPPVHAVRLRRLDGAPQLRRADGIQLVEIFKEAGETLDWHQGTLSYAGIVHGAGHSHQDILRLVDLVKRTLRIEYDSAS
jgi:biotin carboxylase